MFAEKACAIEPENEWGHRLRALCLISLRRKKESIAAAKEAVRVGPNEINALLTLADLYHQLDYFHEMGEVSQTMLKIAPGSSAVHNTAGIAHLNIGNLTSAEKHFREALRLDPSSAGARNNLGLVELRRDGGTAEAIAHFEAALRLDPAGDYAIENIRASRGITKFLVTAIAFVPLLAAALFILPGLGLILILGILAIGISGLIKSIGSTSGLSKEMRTILKAGGYRSRARNSLRSAAIAAKVAFKFLLPVYLIAFVGIALKTLGLFYGSDGLKYAAYLALLAAGATFYLIGMNRKFEEVDRKARGK
jgi:tetratricopeptide (TPR) repeat protein